MGRNITKEVLNVLEDAGRPLFLGEIVSALGDDFDGSYVMSRLVYLRKRGDIGTEKLERTGQGIQIANAYYPIKKEAIS